MCSVSMIMDHYTDKWRNYSTQLWPPSIPPITPAEVEEFRRLLGRAREYDRIHDQPDCELAEKRERVKALAESLGVKIDFL